MTNHHFSNPADPHDAGPTTGWHQNLASEGHHGEYASQRWAARRNQQPGPVPLQPVQSPLQTDRAAAFVAEFEAAERAKPHTGLKIAGGVLGYALARTYMKRRNSR